MNLNDLRAHAYGAASGKENDTSNGAHSNTENESTPQKPLFRDVNAQMDSIFRSSKKLSREEHPNPSNSNAQTLIKVPADESSAQKKDSVYRRVAKFLVLIGVDEAAKILPHLSPEQTEKIIPEIATIRTISDDEAAVILAEFQGLYKHVTEKGGKETARAILEKAYGSEKAEEMLRKAAPFSGARPFDYLNDAKSERLLLLLNDESNAVKALVLSNIDAKKAADVLNLMTDSDKSDIVKRLAKMQPVSPEVLQRVDQAMHEKALALLENDKSESMDGRNALAEILKKMSPDAESSIISSLSDEDPELGLDLRRRLFTIDDVLNADDKFIQQKLREMQNIDVVKLIAGKPDSFRKKIFGCVSSGRRAEILEEEEISAPLRKADCDSITNTFFSMLRRAYEDGNLIIKGRNDDVYV